MTTPVEIKSGELTTEYKLSMMSAAIGMVLVVFGALLAAGVIPGNENAPSVGNNLVMVGVGLIGAVSAGYSISRGIAKTASRAPTVIAAGTNNKVGTNDVTGESPLSSVYDGNSKGSG